MPLKLTKNDLFCKKILFFSVTEKFHAWHEQLKIICDHISHIFPTITFANGKKNMTGNVKNDFNLEMRSVGANPIIFHL